MIIATEEPKEKIPLIDDACSMTITRSILEGFESRQKSLSVKYRWPLVTPSMTHYTLHTCYTYLRGATSSSSFLLIEKNI